MTSPASLLPPLDERGTLWERLRERAAANPTTMRMLGWPVPALITLLHGYAATSGVPTGRGHAPKEGAWNTAATEFTDYVVVKAGPTRSPASGEPERLGVRATSWLVTVQIIGHGESEDRCDQAATRAVTAIYESIPDEVDLDGTDWRVQYVTTDSLGETRFSNQIKEWRVVYDVSLHLSRVHAR